MPRPYAVTLEHGPAWDDARPLREQDSWDEHAAFMDGLVDDGFVVLGGPVDGGAWVLQVVLADSAEAIRERFAQDPWAPMDLLRVMAVEPWEVLLGELPMPAG
jgi:uncharacterized protein YciI